MASKVIIPFYGNHADIPAGWERCTALDGKFAKAYGTQAVNVSGGNATHTHTSSSHTHTMGAHTHTVVTSSYTGNQQAGSGSNIGRNAHTHSGTPAVGTSNVQNVTATYAAYSNLPPYVDVIFIQKANVVLIPTNGIVLWNSATAPDRAGLKLADGNNSTVNLNGKYLRGAAALGNAGGTGGSTSNTHTLTHTHTAEHTHSGASGTPSSVSQGNGNGGGTKNDAAPYHTHTISLSAATPTSGDNSDVGAQAETVEPAYHKLMAYQNVGLAGELLVSGAICMCLETEIPTGWLLCDGNNGTPNLADKFIKITTTSGEIGNTGGSNTHTHAAQGHTHTVPAHTHGGSAAETTNLVAPDGSGDSNYWYKHSHSLASVSSDAASLASANTTADSSDNQPPYLTVKYIMATSAALGGGSACVIDAFL